MEFHHFRRRLFTIGCNITVRNLSGERIDSTSLVIGVMVPIDTLDSRVIPRNPQISWMGTRRWASQVAQVCRSA
jgi:hypothetical protein